MCVESVRYSRTVSDQGKTVNQVVARNITRWRKAAGLTQEELGQRLGGWSNAAVSAAERSWDGKRIREFDADTIVALAAALGVPLTAMFLPPDDSDDPGMGELFARIMPESLDETPVMDAYREALAVAAGRYMGPLRADDLQDYLKDMVNADGRHDRLRRRVEDLQDFEAEYRRRMRAYLESQLDELGPPEEDR